MSGPRAVVLISADIEWAALLDLLGPEQRRGEHTPVSAPPGASFRSALPIHGREEEVLFFHGGWGKIAAAATAQQVIDEYRPQLLVNLGTCGGFDGHIERGTIVLVERTVVYDILEQMTDPSEAIAHFTTELDLSWLAAPYPSRVTCGPLVSGDKDLVPEEIPRLHERYGAVAGDWESGSIAWVAARAGTRCLILRGVSDLVGAAGGEAYDGGLEVFAAGTRSVLGELLEELPGWLERGLTAP